MELVSCINISIGIFTTLLIPCPALSASVVGVGGLTTIVASYRTRANRVSRFSAALAVNHITVRFHSYAWTTFRCSNGNGALAGDLPLDISNIFSEIKYYDIKDCRLCGRRQVLELGELIHGHSDTLGV